MQSRNTAISRATAAVVQTEEKKQKTHKNQNTPPSNSFKNIRDQDIGLQTAVDNQTIYLVD